MDTDHEIIKCDLCNKEIPKSAAMTSEGKEYTWHFCGEACHEKWKHEKK